MGDDIIQRLFNKIDDLKDQIAVLNVKVGKIETKLEEKEKGNKNILGALAWIATTAIAVYGAWHK